MFCSCRVTYGEEPNTHTCPVCLGHPGALPVINEKAVELGVMAGLALNCQVAPRAVFARKNYFYPDLPKGYQISQFDQPICKNGHLDVPTPEGTIRVGITRLHLEEDAAKNVHVGESGRMHGSVGSLVDFNRAGTPLIEIVTEPDIPSPEAARATANHLKAILQALGVSEYDAGVLTSDHQLASFYEEVTADEAVDPKHAANWTSGELRALLNEAGIGISESKVEPGHLAELLGLVENGTVSRSAAKDV